MIMEREKEVRLHEAADVVVAGAGIAGSFAAIAAARHGAKTVLADRFGAMGGNIGPALLPAGTLLGGSGYAAEDSVLGGFAGLSLEFRRRVEALNRDEPMHAQSFTTSYVLGEMAREAGVEWLPSAYAADPVMDGSAVTGLFVETCGGRVAIAAKVVVDATGEASIAARAGAPMIRHTPADPSWGRMVSRQMNDLQYAWWNDTHLLVMVAGVDWARFESCQKESAALSYEDERWAAQYWAKDIPRRLVPAARRAFEQEGFRIHGDIEAKVPTYVSPLADMGAGVVSYRVGARGQIDCDDAAQMARIENFVRRQGYRFYAFMKRECPGFERAFVVGMSSFLGMRGGPCIDGEHVLTVEEQRDGARFDDALYRNVHAIWAHGAAASGFDVPYRCLLPRRIDGLLVAGRGAAFIRRGHDPSAMRARVSMMVLGEAAGAAAAMAAAAGVAPRKLDVKQLQRRLVAAGFSLGPPERLRELGLT